MNNSFKKIFVGFVATSLIFLTACSTTVNLGTQLMSVNNKKVYENEMYYNIYGTIGQNYYGIIEYDPTADIDKVKSELETLSQDADMKEYINQIKVLFVKKKIADEEVLAFAKANNITLSEEEQKEIDELVESNNDYFTDKDVIESIATSQFANNSNPTKEAKYYLSNYKKAWLSYYGSTNMKEYKTIVEQAYLINKALLSKKDEVADDETVIKQYYDDLLKQQQEEFVTDLQYFESTIENEQPILFYPQGLRYVKHILIKYNEDDQTKISEFETKITELEEKETLTDEEKSTLEQTKSELATLQEKLETDAKTTAEQVYEKVVDGEDFDALTEEYGQDPGMKKDNENYQENGYLAYNNSNLVKEFLDVALALQNVGDVSKPVKSTYGYHIIKYTSAVESKTVSYEEARDKIITDAMEEVRTQYIDDYYNQVFKEGFAKETNTVNYDVLGMTKEEYDIAYNNLMSVE